MNAKKRLIRVFESLEAAWDKLGADDQKQDIANLVSTLHDGTFFTSPADRQKENLRWYGEAYLGRGELLEALVFNEVLSRNFYDEMRTALLEYRLTIEVSEESMIHIQNHLSRIRGRCPE